MLAATELDVAEVLRETAASDAAVAGVVAGTMAAAALVVGIVLVVRERDHLSADTPGLGVVVVLAGSATVVELALLVFDGAAVTDRRPMVAVARLLLIVGAISVQRLPVDDPLVARLPFGLGAGALATVVLGAPALGSAADVGLALAVTLAAVGGAAVLLGLLARGGARPVAAVAVAVLVLAVPASLALVPDRVPSHHEERIVVDDVVLDVTVAPLRPGGNEVHLYAWDDAGAPLAVASSSVEVRGHAATRHELFVVDPNHHLSYALELPHADAWQLLLTARVEDGPVVDATLDLKAP